MRTTTKEDIINAICKLYAQHTYEQISVSQIIKESGLSKGALYWHFPDKAAMFAAAYQHCLQLAVDAQESSYVPDMNVLLFLKKRIHSMLYFERENPDCLVIIKKHYAHMQGGSGLDSPYDGPFSEGLRLCAMCGLKRGEMKPLPEEMLYLLINIIDEAVLRYVHANPWLYDDPAALEKLIDQMYSALEA